MLRQHPVQDVNNCCCADGTAHNSPVHLLHREEARGAIAHGHCPHGHVAHQIHGGWWMRLVGAISHGVSELRAVSLPCCFDGTKAQTIDNM